MGCYIGVLIYLLLRMHVASSGLPSSGEAAAQKGSAQYEVEK